VGGLPDHFFTALNDARLLNVEFAEAEVLLETVFLSSLAIDRHPTVSRAILAFQLVRITGGLPLDNGLDIVPMVVRGVMRHSGSWVYRTVNGVVRCLLLSRAINLYDDPITVFIKNLYPCVCIFAPDDQGFCHCIELFPVYDATFGSCTMKVFHKLVDALITNSNDESLLHIVAVVVTTLCSFTASLPEWACLAALTSLVGSYDGQMSKILNPEQPWLSSPECRDRRLCERRGLHLDEVEHLRYHLDLVGEILSDGDDDGQMVGTVSDNCSWSDGDGQEHVVHRHMTELSISEFSSSPSKV
jgi:hypothetical protein